MTLKALQRSEMTHEMAFKVASHDITSHEVMLPFPLAGLTQSTAKNVPTKTTFIRDELLGAAHILSFTSCDLKLKNRTYRGEHIGDTLSRPAQKEFLLCCAQTDLDGRFAVYR